MPHTAGPYAIGERFEANTADEIEAAIPDAYTKTDLSAQGFLPVKAGPYTIAWVVHDDNDPECEANAALFRAAPDLLAFAQAWIDHVGPNPQLGGNLAALDRMARAALAKAGA